MSPASPAPARVPGSPRLPLGLSRSRFSPLPTVICILPKAGLPADLHILYGLMVAIMAS